MQTESAIRSAYELMKWLRVLAVGMSSVAAILLAAAVLWPVDAAEVGLDMAVAEAFGPIAVETRDLDALLRETAGRDMIRPPQAQAAVKDTGLAARLAKKLDLQGVVQMQDRLIAYIQIKEIGVTTVSQGDTILEFNVKEVVPGRVTLTLEGVEVSLR